VDLVEQDCGIIHSLDARVGISYGTGRLLKVDIGGLLDIGFAASREWLDFACRRSIVASIWG
jgi:hypothetical protein